MKNFKRFANFEEDFILNEGPWEKGVSLAYVRKEIRHIALFAIIIILIYRIFCGE